ncbi:MAG: chromosomal replication initiator protein DnaA, partial [Comamonadaceae bacterium]|nr:chromosomal replication initiator protein DnaA [Comamonadaceae bacterium]
MNPVLWRRSCERLAVDLPEHQFNTWIRPLVVHDAGTDDASEDSVPEVLTVRVANRFKLDWIRSQYAGRIEAALAEVAGKPVRLELALLPRAESAPAGAPASAAPATLRHGGTQHAAAALALPPGMPSGVGVGANAPRALPPAATSHRLNASLTFDTLVAGRANSIARTAA